MAVHIELPAELEDLLRRELGDLDRAAKEAMLVELYRQDKITRAQLGQALTLSRFEVDGLLKQHHVTEDLPTLAELHAELDEIDRRRKS